MRLFVYEYACAQPPSVLLPDSVRREGRAMFEAVLEDARELESDIEVITVPVTQDSAHRTQDYYVQADYALIIAPEFEGILEAQARWALEAGCQLLGPRPEAIRLTADKWQLYQHWKQRGVLTPETRLATSSGVQGQYLTKHRYGAGSLGVGRWQPGDVLASEHMIQEYIEGTPVSLAFLMTPGGEPTPLLPCVQHISEESRFEYRGGSLLQEPGSAARLVQAATRAVEGIPGLQGYVGVDAIMKKDQVYVLEINPRLTTSYLGLRQMCKNNLIAAMLTSVVDRKKVPLSWHPGTVSWPAGGTSCRL